MPGGPAHLYTNGAPVTALNPLVVDINASSATKTVERTAFGGSISESIKPVVQIIFDTPFIRTDVLDIHEDGAGSSVSIDNSRALVTAGVTATGHAILQSVKTIQYKPGFGVLNRFSAAFGTPDANVEQLAGLGNSGNGFYFGYNGTSFGILHRRNGKSTILKITVSAGMNTGSHAISFDLPGVGGVINYAVIVGRAAGAGSTTFSAFEIANKLNANASFHLHWTASSVGSDIYMIAHEAEVMSVAGGVAFNDSGTPSGLAFTPVVSDSSVIFNGVDPTDDWYPLASWNGAEARYLQNLTWTNGNVFTIQFQWLGYGAINFFVERPETGSFVHAHSIYYAGKSTVPSVEDPTFASRFQIYNSGVPTAAPTMITASAMIGREGEDGIYTTQKTASVSSKNIGAATTEVLIAFKNRVILSDKQENRRDVHVRSITVLSDSSKVTAFKVIKNGTVVGDVATQVDYPLWVAVSNSVALFDNSALATAPADGVVIAASGVAANGSETIVIDQGDFILEPNDIISVVVTTITGGGGNFDAFITYVEDI